MMSTSIHSMPQQMWRGWSWATSVTSMTSGRSLKNEERRWAVFSVLGVGFSLAWELHAIQHYFFKMQTCSLVMHNCWSSVCLNFNWPLSPLPPAGVGVRHQIHGDQRKGKHQRGKRKLLPLSVCPSIDQSTHVSIHLPITQFWWRTCLFFAPAGLHGSRQRYQSKNRQEAGKSLVETSG